MALDVVDLREFYMSALGLYVRRALRARLARLWPSGGAGDAILTLGFGTPLMRPWLATAGRLIAVMPADQGGLYWPKEGPNVTVLSDPSALPLPDESMDKAVCLHILEQAPDPDAVLRDVWRVLRPHGRIVVIVPHRRGFWAHHDGTPFGTGRPYSAPQLRASLRAQGFTVRRTGRALFFPPFRFGFWARMAERMEIALGPFWPPFGGGVLVVEAEKQVYAPLLSTARSARRIVLPVPFPVSSGPALT